MIEKSLLIIDDERRMTESLAELFDAEGIEVVTANSGAEGIDKLKARAFPVVVTDLRMQGVDGLNVVRYIHDHRPKTLVIVITGYASTDSAIEALHYRAFDYIRKPFEFERLKAAIDRAFDKLEVERLREDMAAMITHDIKVPLTSIIGFAGMIHNKEKDECHPRAAEFAERVRQNAQKILSLVDNFLASSKIESGNLVILPARARIDDMLADLRNVITPEADRRGFLLDFEGEVDPAEAVFDEGYVYRSIGNLLQNALKYGDPAEPIEVRVARLPAAESPIGKDSLRISVSNLAPALTPEMLPNLFGRYQRSPESGGIEGTGLGLYVVDAVARAHGGRAQAECLPGGRVAFSLVLPMEAQAEAKMT
jgi:signal transduction histidine kinase